MPRRVPSSFLVYHPEKRNATPAKKGALFELYEWIDVLGNEEERDSLGDTKEEPTSNDACKVVDCAGATADDSPDDHAPGEIPTRTNQT